MAARFCNEMVWKNITAQELDWSWERSLDGGKTWQVALANPLQEGSLTCYA